MRKYILKFLCFIGIHDWSLYQENFNSSSSNKVVVICWKQCEYCAKSKVVHILV